MDADRDRFLQDFAALVQDLLRRPTAGPQDGTPLKLLLEEHLGRPLREVDVLTHQLPAHRLVDADIALDRLAEAGGGTARTVGIAGGDERYHQSLVDLLSSSWGASVAVGAVDHRTAATGPTAVCRVVGLGVRLLSLDGTPVAVVQRGAVPHYGRPAASLEVLAPDWATAQRLVERVTALMREHSVLRGQVLGFTASDYDPSSGGLTFLPRPDVARDDVVLPAGVLDAVEQHVLHTDRQRALLRRYGQHVKRGLLLHGPPGTGKTHLVRHLIGRASGATVILLSGSAFAMIAEAAALARALAPAVVVLEDVDLVAADRGYTPGGNPLLFAVLDALDGLDADADVAFLMTTNRVDLLEEALVQRPGRVDLAVHIDRPGRPERERLLRRYAAGIPVGEATVARIADRSAGTTASFMKELVRRAVLRAGRAGADLEHGAVLDPHLEASADELLESAGDLTRAILGGARGGAPEGEGTGGYVVEVGDHPAGQGEWFDATDGTH
ncbi:ATP-binding protein [Tersicoccus sp. MR15.9]|uniref:AAA family ATPase n=1 Tax=Tersicoccus mangrovi TaxID=3121635 RepID=UPI002FE66D3B